MIRSKEDLKYYMERDRAAIMKEGRPRPFTDEVWRFLIHLRKYEYALNCYHSVLLKPLLLYRKMRYHRSGLKLGFSIPPNVIEEGLGIFHYGTIIVSTEARIGKNCRIMNCVNIGGTGGSTDSATIGDNVFIGFGAKLFGKITIADNIAIGAGSVVVSSFTQPGITIAGVPARKISDKDSSAFYSSDPQK